MNNTILILGASGTVGGAIFRRLSNPPRKRAGNFTSYDSPAVYGTFYKNPPFGAGDIQPPPSLSGTEPHRAKTNGAVNEKYYRQWDMANPAGLQYILEEIQPAYVVSALNGNFEHQLSAHRLAAEYLQKSGGFFIFLSTANVFDGSPDAGHSEADTPYPISAYGKFKYACEQLLAKKLNDRCLIIRLPKIVSAKDTPAEMKYLERNPRTFSNLFMSFNTVENAAAGIQYYIEEKMTGVVHLTSTDGVPMETFARFLAGQSPQGISLTVETLTAETYGQLFSCDDTGLLRCNADNNFYLTLKSIKDLPERLAITCAKALSAAGPEEYR
jgi:dTDP-4-dehydrorhamnose reductase